MAGVVVGDVVEALHKAAVQAHTGVGPYQVVPEGMTSTAELQKLPGTQHWSDLLTPGKPGSAADDPPLLDVWFPVGGVVLYMIGVPILEKIFRAIGTDGSSSIFKLLCIIHNVLLIGYSGWAMYHTVPQVFGRHVEDSYWDAYCDKGWKLRAGTMLMQVYLNYISKFYEFLDTVILLVKGKKVPLLQSYHHAGIVVTMWLLSASRSPNAQYMVAFNATIHTIMYTYYLGTILGMGRVLTPLKPLLTTCQILQFCVGISFGFFAVIGNLGYWHLLSSTPMEDCLTSAMSLGTMFTFAYLCPLMYLFLQFFYNSYIAPKKTTPPKKDDKKTN